MVPVFLDIGGESTRPGSDSVDGEEERNRVIPVIKAVRAAYPQAVISIDTYRADTAEAALAAGADIINDVTAMEADPKMADLVVKSKAPIILMHMRGTPKKYAAELRVQKRSRRSRCLFISKSRIIAQPRCWCRKDYFRSGHRLCENSGAKLAFNA